METATYTAGPTSRVHVAAPLARVDALTKRYGALTALSNVSLSIRRGEILGLIGPNGAGKTTLFECMAGLLPADHGSVSVGGEPIRVADRGRHLFYLPDGIAPWPSQSLGWALRFTRGFFGSADAADALGDRVVDRLGLQPLLNARIGTLSKGQRKRALLAVGLLAPQPIFLADEPFDGLDLRQTREVAAALREHTASGRTLFLSIHQITDAARVCDRFVLLAAGRVCGEGTFDELAREARRGDAPPPSTLEEVVLALT